MKGVKLLVAGAILPLTVAVLRVAAAVEYGQNSGVIDNPYCPLVSRATFSGYGDWEGYQKIEEMVALEYIDGVQTVKLRSSGSPPYRCFLWIYRASSEGMSLWFQRSLPNIAQLHCIYIPYWVQNNLPHSLCNISHQDHK